MAPRFLAIDWGTTNRRVFLIEGGTVIASDWSPRGAAVVEDFAAEVASIREELGDQPMLLAGMVGSTIGWKSVAYVAAPAGLAELSAAVEWIDARTAIVPGISWRDGLRADVMRGEEVQLLGAVVAGLVPGDALLCQPGTHCKWAWLENGRIERFVTAMTGELFALLRQHSLLAAQLGSTVEAGNAFRAGVSEGARGDLTASLFAIRASGLLGLRSDTDAASYASGLLIGADFAQRLPEVPAGPVYILSDPALGLLYATAIETLGQTSTLIDSHAAFVAGIGRIWEMLQ